MRILLEDGRNTLNQDGMPSVEKEETCSSPKLKSSGVQKNVMVAKLQRQMRSALTRVAGYVLGVIADTPLKYPVMVWDRAPGLADWGGGSPL